MVVVLTTVEVSEKTLQMLNGLKKKLRAGSHDEVIRSLIEPYREGGEAVTHARTVKKRKQHNKPQEKE